jgi:hypothetical protein
MPNCLKTNSRLQLVHAFATGPYQALHCPSATIVISTRVEDGNRQLLITSSTANVDMPNASPQQRVVWKAPSHEKLDELKKPQLTSVLPIGMDIVILGYGK